jgi:hypothetical protein
MEMIHLYIYFKQENAKKNLFFLLLFCGICFAQNTVSGKLLLRRNLFRKSRAYWKKQYPRMFLGTILLNCHQETLKYLFPALVFNLLIR